MLFKDYWHMERASIDLLFSFELCLAVPAAEIATPSQKYLCLRLLFSFELCFSERAYMPKEAILACYFLLNYAQDRWR